MRNVYIHDLPDFADELAIVFKAWNNAQAALRFISFRPSRPVEVRLLTRGELDTDTGLRLVADARVEANIPESAIVILFTEKRLYDDEYYQLFFMGRGLETVISLDFTKRFFGKHRHAVFKAILINLLTTVSHKFNILSHYDTRACVMDFLNNMPDILKSMDSGPIYCDECSSTIQQGDLQFLLQLARATQTLEDMDELARNVSESLYARKVRLEDEESEYDYDIALSFAGEDRPFAARLAEALRDSGVKVFYDAFEKANLWGKNLYAYLSDVYRLRARFCIPLLSKHYADKLWTNHEREAAQDRAFRENREYLLPVRLNDTKIPGVLDTVGYLSLDDEGIDGIVQCVLQKLGQ